MNRNMFDLTGKVAVVVGGTSGIGRTLALGLAEAGAHVVASGRRESHVDAVAGEIEARGRRTLRITSDVQSTVSVEALAHACVSAFGAVQIVVVAAGVTTRGATRDVSDDEWERILDTNLSGTLRACRAFGGHMIDRRYGRIINIASLTSFVGLYEVAAYGASKSGVAGLTRALAVEWAPFAVTVNAVAPGLFRTDLNAALLDSPRGQELLMRTPMKRFGQLDELVGATVFLASDASTFVTGQLLTVDGGFLASGVNQ